MGAMSSDRMNNNLELTGIHREITRLLEENADLAGRIQTMPPVPKIRIPKGAIRTVAALKREYHLDLICPDPRTASSVAYALELHDLFSWASQTFAFYGAIEITLYKYMAVNLISVMEALMQQALIRAGLEKRPRRHPEGPAVKAGLITKESRRQYSKLNSLRNYIHVAKAEDSEIREARFSEMQIRKCARFVQTLAGELAMALHDRKKLSGSNVPDPAGRNASVPAKIERTVSSSINTDDCTRNMQDLLSGSLCRFKPGHDIGKGSGVLQRPSKEQEYFLIRRIIENNRRLSLLFEQCFHLKMKEEESTARLRAAFPRSVIRTVKVIREECDVDALCPDIRLANNLIYAFELDDLMRYFLNVFDLYGGIRVVLLKNMLINLVSIMEGAISFAVRSFETVNSDSKTGERKVNTRDAVKEMVRQGRVTPFQADAYDCFYRIRNRIHLGSSQKNEIRENLFTEILAANCRELAVCLIVCLGQKVGERQRLAERAAILDVLKNRKDL